MKYRKTLDLWDNDTVESIQNGTLKVQCGQWVTCGDSQKSRFVSCNPKSGTFNVAHGGSNREVNQKFKQRINAKNKVKQL